MPDQTFVPGGAYNQPPQQNFPPAGQPPPAGPDARKAMTLPAIFVMVASGISILLWLVWIGLIMLGVSAGSMKQMNEAQAAMGIGFWVIVSLLSIIASIVALIGGWKMKNLESYGLAMTAAIICIIPCTGPCCGLPFGIWALVVLLRPEVKAAFQR